MPVTERLGDRTRGELYESAQERKIEGRSSMTKHELIEALSDEPDADTGTMRA